MAKNSVGSTNITAHVVVNRNDEDFSISADRRMDDRGSYLDELECSINTYRYYKELNWYKDGKPVKERGPHNQRKFRL